MLPLAKYLPGVSRLAMGCMGFGGSWDKTTVNAEQQQQAFNAIDTALAHGINLFDHADIYTHGKAEQVFGQYLAQPGVKRQNMFIQTKCAIRFADEIAVGRYDFSAEYIVASVEQSLRRLNTDYIDILLLHRPDPLMQPEQVAQAFEQLQAQGKVRYFGVSNMGWAQMQLLQSALNQPLLVNQLQMSLADINWLEEGVLVGMPQGSQHHFGYGTVEYCQQHGVQLQSWGSLAKGVFSGAPAQNTEQAATAKVVAKLAIEYNCSPEAIVLAWLMRHPAAVQPVIGSIQPARIAASAQAVDVNLSREHWYQLYVSSRGGALP